MATSASEMNILPLSELRAKVRGLLSERSEDFNVLVVGEPGSCKSTLINSMNMALAEQWCELASFGQGGATNNTLSLDKVLMFEDKYMKEKVENYEKKVYFWDCAGMENTADEVYGEFIGLTLDGKVPDKTNVFAVLKKKDELIPIRDLQERFATVNEENRFHRLLFLCACDEAAPENLLKLVKETTASLNSKGRNIPVFLVLTKMDKIKDNEAVYKETKKMAFSTLNLRGNKQRTTELKLYHADIEEEDAGCAVDAFSGFLPNEDIDRNLLILLCNLLHPSFDRNVAHGDNAEIKLKKRSKKRNHCKPS